MLIGGDSDRRIGGSDSRLGVMTEGALDYEGRCTLVPYMTLSPPLFLRMAMFYPCAIFTILVIDNSKNTVFTAGTSGTWA